MINEYRCKETFYPEKCDENGMLTDMQFTVAKGSRWQEDTDIRYRICGGPDTVRLDRIAANKPDWLELTKETVKQFFEQVN